MLSQPQDVVLDSSDLVLLSHHHGVVLLQLLVEGVDRFFQFLSLHLPVVKNLLSAFLMLHLRFFSLHLLDGLHLIELDVLESLVLVLQLVQNLELVPQFVLHVGHLVIDAGPSKLNLQLLDVLLDDLCLLLLTV